MRKVRKLCWSTQLVMRNRSSLLYLADGTKLKPTVIFKRKTLPKENFPPGVLLHCHLKGVDGRSWNEAMGRENMVVTTRRSSKKEKSLCLGLLPGSSCQLSEVSSSPNKHQHRCDSRRFNQHSSTARRFLKQAF